MNSVLKAAVWAACLFLVVPCYAQNQKQLNLRRLVPPDGDRLTTRMSTASPGEVKVSFGWTRGFTQTDALSLGLDIDTNVLNTELRADYVRTFGDFTISPGIATSFGRGSPASGTRIYVFKELSAALFLEYAGSLLEVRSFTDIWMPIQESQNTALWVVKSRNFGALRWGDLGIGPRYEVSFAKDGAAQFRLFEMWFGLFFIQYWPSAIFTLSLGYDTVELASFQGSPKSAGWGYRCSFGHAF